MPTASINFGTGVSSAWSNVATFIPKLAAFLAILIIGYIIAKLISKFLPKLLTRAGFDRMAERGAVKTALDRSKYSASGIVAKLVFYAIMLFVLSMAFGVFGTNPVSTYLHAVIAYLPLLFVAIIIIVIASAIAAAARNLIENSLGGLTYARLLGNLASGFILAIGVIAALDQLHIAQNVVDAVLYAVLAAMVGIAIVSVGGGGIRTMSERWERAAVRYDEEKPKVAAATGRTPSIPEQAHHDTPRETAGSATTSGYPQAAGPRRSPGSGLDGPEPFADH